MKFNFFAIVLLSIALTTACSTTMEEAPETFIEQVEPGIVVRTTFTPDWDATSILVDEVRNAVLADARFTGTELAWEARILDPALGKREQSLPATPSPQVLNAMLVEAWREVSAEVMEGVEPLDSPGCDGIPNGSESHCMQNCCAAHDKCFEDNGCSSSSWYSDEGAACTQCNRAARSCVGKCVFNPPDCNQTQCGCNRSSCYDDDCDAGKTFYCANDCNNPGASPCARGPYPQDLCAQAGGATRFSQHGGAAVACVPWCENGGNGRASGWWWDETLYCCVCEKGYNRNTWPWAVMPWPYPIPEIHFRNDGHFGTNCTYHTTGKYWICG